MYLVLFFISNVNSCCCGWKGLMRIQSLVMGGAAAICKPSLNIFLKFGKSFCDFISRGKEEECRMMLCFGSILMLLPCLWRQLKSRILACIWLCFFCRFPCDILRSLQFHHLFHVLTLLPVYITSLEGFCTIILLIIECQVQHRAGAHETFGIVEAVNEADGKVTEAIWRLNMAVCRRHLLVLISWIWQMRHCDKRMIKSFRGRDSPVSINVQH